MSRFFDYYFELITVVFQRYCRQRAPCLQIGQLSCKCLHRLSKILWAQVQRYSIVKVPKSKLQEANGKLRTNLSEVGKNVVDPDSHGSASLGRIEILVAHGSVYRSDIILSLTFPIILVFADLNLVRLCLKKSGGTKGTNAKNNYNRTYWTSAARTASSLWTHLVSGLSAPGSTAATWQWKMLRQNVYYRKTENLSPLVVYRPYKALKPYFRKKKLGLSLFHVHWCKNLEGLTQISAIKSKKKQNESSFYITYFRVIANKKDSFCQKPACIVITHC